MRVDKLNVARSEIPAVTHIDYSARDCMPHTEQQNPALKFDYRDDFEPD